MGQKNVLNQVWEILRSKKLASILILIIIIVSTIGIINQKANIFQSQWFALLGAIFLINLTSCTIHQVYTSWSLWKRARNPVVWGSSIIHIGLILITVGGLFSGNIKMEGRINIAEGETRYELHDNYEGIIEGMFFSESWHKGFGITLKKQNVNTDKNGKIADIVSDIEITENNLPVKKFSVGEKESIIYNDIRIFDKESGFAPQIFLSGPNNTNLGNTYLLLNTDKQSAKTRFHTENIKLPPLSPYILNLEFFPDMIELGGKLSTDTYLLDNPGLSIKVIKDKKTIKEKILRQGESIEFDGYKIKMGDVRHWNGFDIVNDPGAGYVFAGSSIALVGFGLIYLPLSFRTKKGNI
jgi:cytochrome c biogenesis protein ResB